MRPSHDRAGHPDDQAPSRPALHVVQGLVMGVADVIPGVSGGTAALILGIYDRFVGAIRSAGSIVLGLRHGPGGALDAARGVEWRFLLPLLAGIGSALVLGAQVIPPLLEHYPAEMRAVFFGLIAGSIVIPWRHIEEQWLGSWVLAGIGAVAAFVIVGLPPRELAAPSLTYVFLAAMVAICAMLLPGISGAFFLLVLGIYDTTLRALSGLRLDYIGVFALGAVLGILVFSRFLGWLLDRRHDQTMAVLVGLMAGSLRALWPWLGEERELLAPPDGVAVLIAVLLALAGVLAVTLLTRAGDRMAHP